MLMLLVWFHTLLNTQVKSLSIGNPTQAGLTNRKCIGLQKLKLQAVTLTFCTTNSICSRNILRFQFVSLPLLAPFPLYWQFPHDSKWIVLLQALYPQVSKPSGEKGLFPSSTVEKIFSLLLAIIE